MPDYQQIADDVRSVIDAEDQTLDPALERLAQDYADVAKTANARLRRCGDLLRRGLRSEAIHLAQEQPDLLDMVAALDVPGLEQWENVCTNYGLAKPPKLMMDVAAELNDAYATEEPLAASLDELRLLVLGRAPAVRRLAVTRRLRALDPDTPHWTSDAIELERACLATVKQDVARVVASADPHAARHLGETLASPDWIKPPPRELIEALTQVELQGLVQEMAHLQADGNTRKTKQLIELAEKLAASRKMPLPADLATGINEARAWLRHQKSLAEEQTQFHEACGALEAALFQDAPLEVIESLHARAAAFGMPLPEPLATQYAGAEKDKRLVADRAKRRNLIVLAVVLVAVAVGTILMVQRMRTQSAATDAMNRLNYAREQFDFPTGQKAWEDLQTTSPAIAAREDVIAAHTRMEQAAAAETKRLSDFAAAREAAAATTLSIAERTARLDTADRLARLDSEKLKIKVLRRQWLPPAAAPATPAAVSPETPQSPATDKPAASAAETNQSPPAPVAVITPAAVVTPAPTPSAAPRILFEKDITIPATAGKDDQQVSVGPVARGAVVHLSYVSGEWTAFPRSDHPPKSPDDLVVAHENVLRPRLCEVTPEGLKELVFLPGGTKQHPFDFKADHAISKLVLNTSDGRPRNNSGAVVYHVTITER